MCTLVVALFSRIIAISSADQKSVLAQLKNRTQVLAKNRSHSAAQERPYKPKSLMDFDESDESIEEEDELDAGY